MTVMLQVRNLPDEVHAKLKQRAKDAGLSLSEFVGRELADLVSTRSNAEIVAWAKENRAGVARRIIVDEIRASRDEHDIGGATWSSTPPRS